MKIIVVGIGKVGYTVAEELSSEGHDITAIDTSKAALDETIAGLDVIGIHGNGASRPVLEEAGVSESDLLIALTGSDELNLLCCLLASKLGAKGTIARVRTPEYYEDLDLIKDSLGISIAVNPEREAASEIFRILKFPFAKNVDVFAKGKIDLVSFQVEKNCLFDGKTIKDAFSEIRAKVLVCAVERGEEVFIPTGRFEICENDTVAILAAPDEIPPFFRQIRLTAHEIKNAIIIGGGRLTHYLAAALEHTDISATIIEKDPVAAENLSLLFPRANIICGDGTNRDLLLEEGLADADALCCLTGFDEENIILSLFAKGAVPGIKTIAKVNRTAFHEVTKSLDIGSVIYPKFTTSNLILQHVRARQNSIGSNVETLNKIIDNKVEAVEFHLSEDSGLCGKTLEELSLRQNVLIGCISRKGNIIIPHGKDVLLAGDSVVVVTTITGLDDLNDIEEK